LGGSSQKPAKKNRASGKGGFVEPSLFDFQLCNVVRRGGHGTDKKEITRKKERMEDEKEKHPRRKKNPGWGLLKKATLQGTWGEDGGGRKGRREGPSLMSGKKWVEFPRRCRSKGKGKRKD